MVLAYLLATLALLAINAFFVIAEFAIIRIRPSRLEELIDQGNPRAKAVQAITTQMDEYLAVSQVGITLASVGLGFVGEPAIARLVEPLFGEGGLAIAASHGIAVTISYIVVSGSHVVIGEQVPKMIAVAETEKIALLTAQPLMISRKVLYVPLKVLSWFTEQILRLMGRSGKVPEERHSEDELRIILADSQSSGVMSFRRLLFVENVFDLGELKVRDAMRTRGSVKSVKLTAAWPDNAKVIRDSRLSRYPILEDGNPKPIGLLHVKDLVLAGHALDEAPDLRKLARPFLTTTETTPLEGLLAELQRKRAHMAIVVDKNDRWTGLITLEDVIEEIVGAVEDEYEIEPPIYLADTLSVGRIVLGVEAATLDECVKRALAKVPQAELPIPAQTIGRMVLDRSRLVSTYLGRGLSIPHARADGLEKALLVFARSDTGVPVPGRDEKSYLHFILVTPSHLPHVHVRLLARIGGIFESEYVEERLREAKTPQEVLEAIRAGEGAALG